jgi:hypothetical protein
MIDWMLLATRGGQRAHEKATRFQADTRDRDNCLWRHVWYFAQLFLAALVVFVQPDRNRIDTKEESDIEMATAQMERALRVEGWLWCPEKVPSFSVLSVAMTDGIIGCPHQEGIDYQGQWCPVCELWKGRDRFTGERVHWGACVVKLFRCYSDPEQVTKDNQ